MNYIEVVLLSFIEGLTEFLPVSSTGHLILTSALLGINEDQFVKAFNIIIQFGAILSVLFLYWRRFLPNKQFYLKIFVAFLPAAVIGLMVKNIIDQILGSPLVVAIALVLGGFVLMWSDRMEKRQSAQTITTVENLSLKKCLYLGLLQCFAFIPGVSRAGATIVGGMWLGLPRKEAAEFSFFLAVPTLTGAALIKSLKLFKDIEPGQIHLLLAGTVLSFIFALFAIRFFMKIVSRYGFFHFGVYRVIVGGAILALIFSGRI